MYNKYRVLLPVWVWDSKSKQEFKANLASYMTRYPHYKVVGLDGPYAICERI